MVENVEKTIKKIIKKHKINEIEITDKTYLIDDLVIDSLSYIYIICDIENALEIEIDDEYLNIDGDITFKEFCELINELLLHKRSEWETVCK
ncbi:MAG: hypothetical protein ACERKV_13205 [Clostridiaceae bacterium]